MLWSDGKSPLGETNIFIGTANTVDDDKMSFVQKELHLYYISYVDSIWRFPNYGPRKLFFKYRSV